MLLVTASQGLLGYAIGMNRGCSPFTILLAVNGDGARSGNRAHLADHPRRPRGSDWTFLGLGMLRVMKEENSTQSTVHPRGAVDLGVRFGPPLGNT